MIIGRFWFKYFQYHERINFISIYEITDNIINPKNYKEMNKYWRAINNNKVYPRFNPNTNNQFILQLQDLY